MTSLTARVSLTAAGVLAVCVALIAVVLDQAFRDSAEAAVRERLFAQLYLVMADAELDDQGQVSMPQQLDEARLMLPGSGLYAQIRDADGGVLWRSPSALGLQLTAPSRAGVELFQRTVIEAREYFVASLRVTWETGTGARPLRFAAYEDLQNFETQLGEYRRSLWTWLGGMAVLLLLGQVAALAWGLRPVRQAAAELKAIESGRQQRLQHAYPRELQGLTDNINALLAHEHAQQQRYRNALADLAHSLKTPLAVLRNLDLTAAPAAATLDEQVGRMDEIVQHQLGRAATAGRSALANAQPVAPVIERLLASLHKVHRDKGVQVVAQVAPEAGFRGDPGDLMELLGNLLDNAFIWCRRQVRIEASVAHRSLHLSIADDGPGIPPEQVERVLQRGGRLDEAVPGHGIGLAMVRDLIASYDGELQIGRSPLGGALLRISLPGGACQ